ncbi:hypothetical protein ACVRWL_09645 [Streptococcus ratti]|uniref:Phosphoribosylaminoimidazolecarboxamide formyltransferase n=2 Tax=Streptococcus ratti TaxID=1341 RepID=A0A7X9LEP8_STRRT|nr:hypothetical protein [Streptococcus ratti]EJN94852.1 hypothetical protein SRA_01949 [Streptococcus ratti FA-1 = DSM 20564]EMP71438.1 hypothetical protein D822_01205 [Streptococcus ratti FA-1 = DSM 20564]NMD49896.1 hypothetical protein [Streptococcus ratti]VEI59118.1 Uncharacterised protein [Streptococcus mutans]
MIKKILIYILTFVVTALVINSVILSSLENPLRLSLSYIIAAIMGLVVLVFIEKYSNRK